MKPLTLIAVIAVPLSANCYSQSPTPSPTASALRFEPALETDPAPSLPKIPLFTLAWIAGTFPVIGPGVAAAGMVWNISTQDH
jgi:hypothetical protein